MYTHHKSKGSHPLGAGPGPGHPFPPPQKYGVRRGVVLRDILNVALGTKIHECLYLCVYAIANLFMHLCMHI